jgi:hypothetical protein
MNVIQQDITTVESGVLINGVNCQRVMGSGVARAYFTKWPQVREQYMLWHQSEMVLGKFDPVIIEHDTLFVANCWTQDFFGSDGAEYANYGAILTSVSQAAMFAQRRGLEIYTPWVGCGLGGLAHNNVRDVLENIEGVTGVPITVCELT